MKQALKRIYHGGRRATKWVLLPTLRPRRLEVCCCGLSKTGTHSMAGLFENYRAAHHPDADLRLRLASDYLNGRVTVARAQRLLRLRDRLLWLEMESSALAGVLIEPMLAAFPRRRFILTIRDVYSWCDSWIDHNINTPPIEFSPWTEFDRIRLRIREITPDTIRRAVD